MTAMNLRPHGGWRGILKGGAENMVTIKLKRGNNVILSGLSLEAGEPAFVLDTGKLYLGNGTDKSSDQPRSGCHRS